LSAFAYLIAKINNKIGKIIGKINNLLSMRKIARNWIEPIMDKVAPYESCKYSSDIKRRNRHKRPCIALHNAAKEIKFSCVQRTRFLK